MNDDYIVRYDSCWDENEEFRIEKKAFRGCSTLIAVIVLE